MLGLRLFFCVHAVWRLKLSEAGKLVIRFVDIRAVKNGACAKGEQRKRIFSAAAGPAAPTNGEESLGISFVSLRPGFPGLEPGHIFPALLAEYHSCGVGLLFRW